MAVVGLDGPRCGSGGPRCGSGGPRCGSGGPRCGSGGLDVAVVGLGKARDLRNASLTSQVKRISSIKLDLAGGGGLTKEIAQGMDENANTLLAGRVLPDCQSTIQYGSSFKIKIST